MLHRDKYLCLSVLFIICLFLPCVTTAFNSQSAEEPAGAARRGGQNEERGTIRRSAGYATRPVEIPPGAAATWNPYSLVIGCFCTPPDPANLHESRQAVPCAENQSFDCRLCLVPALPAFQPGSGPSCLSGTCPPPVYCVPLPSAQPQPVALAARTSSALPRAQDAESTAGDVHRCKDGSRSVPRAKLCDNAIDCPDASDETACSCRERIDKTRVCDNYHDCPQGEDELGCFGCPASSYSCGGSPSECFAAEERCDGREQCPTGRDEEDCSLLSLASRRGGDQMFPVGYGEGFLHRNLRGKWYPVCGPADAWARDACASEIGSVSGEPEVKWQTSYPPVEGPYLSESGQLLASCPGPTTHVRCPKVAGGTRHAAEPILGSTANASATDDDPILSIVGGTESAPRAWPFVVVINKNGVFHCGGAILAETWVLSAAHCFDKFQDHYYEIEAGALRRSSYSPALQIRRLRGVIIHERYDPRILKNDIALLLLDEPVHYNSWVRPVLLPESEARAGPQPRPGAVCVAVGWGATSEDGPDPDQLLEVQMPITSCVHREDINPAEICAGYPQGGRDACQGDSGGPLICRVADSSTKWYIGGIVSHGIGCGRQNEPGAYTKVTYFLDWIKNNMRQPPASMAQPQSSCPNFSCATPYPRCLRKRSRCNRVVDCLGAEDEADCPILPALVKG